MQSSIFFSCHPLPISLANGRLNRKSRYFDNILSFVKNNFYIILEYYHQYPLVKKLTFDSPRFQIIFIYIPRIKFCAMFVHRIMENWIDGDKAARVLSSYRLFKVNFTPRSSLVYSSSAPYRPVYVPMRIDRVHEVIGRIVSRPCDATRSVDNRYRRTVQPIKYPPPH